jgi:hypothetical protein
MERPLPAIRRGAQSALHRRLGKHDPVRGRSRHVSVTTHARVWLTLALALLVSVWMAGERPLQSSAAAHGAPQQHGAAKRPARRTRKRRGSCATSTRGHGHERRGRAEHKRAAHRGAGARCPKLRWPVTRGTHRGAAGASGASGASADSAAPATVGSPPGSPVLSAAACFENPGPAGEQTAKIEACGYPGFDNTGVEAGVALKAESGRVIFTRSGWENTSTGEHGTGNWEGHRLTGEVLIEEGAKPATLRNDEIYDEGACHSELCSVNPIDYIAASGIGPSGFVFSHLRVGGSSIRGEDVAQTCINDPVSGTYTAEYVKTIYCSGFKLNGGGVLDHVYCPSDYEISGEHYECVTDQGNPNATQPLEIFDSTIFQPPEDNFGEGAAGGAGPTSAVFLQAMFGAVGELVLEDDFLAGGAEAILDESKAPVTKLSVRRTRFARCLPVTCPHVSHEEVNGEGRTVGAGLQQISGNPSDGHGWFEHVGIYSVLFPISGPPATWQENFYDDDLRGVSLREAE